MGIQTYIKKNENTNIKVAIKAGATAKPTNKHRHFQKRAETLM